MATKEIIVRLIGDVSDFKKNLQSTTKELDSWSKGFSDVGKKAGLAFAGLSGVLAVVGGGALKAAGQFEKFESTLKVMLGTTELAKERLKELEDFAWKTPFELTDVVQLANQLQAIGKYSTQNMTILGDLAAASGKPLSQVTAAYQKLATGQKGMAADMFRNMLISTDDWVKATGKKMKDITAKDMMAALPDIMKNKNFSGMMEETANTFEALSAGISDVMGLTLKDIGVVFLPIAKEIQKSIITILNKIREFVKENPGLVKLAGSFLLIITALTGIVSVIGFLGAGVIKLISTLKMISGVIQIVGVAMKAAFLTNPVFLIIAAIVLLGVAVYQIVKNWDKVKEAFVKFYSYIKTNFSKIAKLLVEIFTNPIGLIIKNWEKILDFYKGLFGKIKGFIKGDKTESAKPSGGSKAAGGGGGGGEDASGDIEAWAEKKGNEGAVGYMNAFLSAVQSGEDILAAIGQEMATQIAESLVASLFEQLFIGLQTLATSLTGLMSVILSPVLSPINNAVKSILVSFSTMLNSLTKMFMDSPIGTAVQSFISAILQPIKLGQIAMLLVTQIAAVAWALIMAIPTLGASLAAIPVAITELVTGSAAIMAVGFASGTSGIEEDMVGQLSKGEMVIPETFSEGIKSGELTLGRGDSSQSIGVSLDGATFNGSFDNDMAMSIGEKIALAIKNNVMSPMPAG